MKPLGEATVAIVGLGLMGGSLALALSKYQVCARVLAITPESDVREHALQLGAVDEASDSLDLAAEADIVVLATPVRVILDQLAPVGRVAKQGAIILDLGSTKEQITEEMHKLPTHVQPIGGHPMCGKEQSGFRAADAGLFQGAAFALTPLARTLPATLDLVRALVHAIGARPVILDPAQHDRIVAAVSHLPFLLAVSLMETASELEQADQLVFALAASGFRDASRLAASDTQMMLDIVATNRESIAQRMQECMARIENVVSLIERKDEDRLRTLFESVAARRRNLNSGSRK